ncbi:type II toxin-antitoxin system Phd/YefM family antitoxin [Paramicrobacterium fandaimingii]|uniref:type II toxin-antitoxin system Phd/YefM family antitoxin n=1 Tax=Paramicrobacterium fandaimingii TaxID=2708079 RepID=UPI001423A6CC|nr:type II toxin-antitoxin system prevent-host-death family antitoxin [Microbacterium fandaimingii]
MAEVTARELRHNMASVLRRVEAGEPLTITSLGRPVAELKPMRAKRRTPIPREELIRRLSRHQADPGLRSDLTSLVGETTDDRGKCRW